MDGIGKAFRKWPAFQTKIELAWFATPASLVITVVTALEPRLTHHPTYYGTARPRV